jgi:cysteine desulfurase
MSGRRIYLDHAATTPVRPEVVEAVAATMTTLGNPSSLHAAGRATRKLVEESRESVAAALGARPSDVIFTGGGTEADNLAIKGLYWARHSADPRRVRLLVSSVEHHAVMDAAGWLAAAQGAKVEWMPVDARGRVEVPALRAALARDPDSVALVSVMWANNEVGTLQPIGEIVDAAHEYGVPVHSDAVQALGSRPVDFAASRLDLMSISAHKIGGPPGAGALIARREIDLVPVSHGGGQERDVRSGTLDAPSIVGFAVAVAAASSDVDRQARRTAELRDALVDGVLAAVPGAVRNGDPVACLPGIANVSVPGCEGDALLLLLDALGVEASTGSACSAGVAEPSHVLLAMGVDAQVARGSLRFSLGRTTTRDDIDAVVAAIGPVVERARAAGLVNRAQDSGRR